jgi:microsomal dipeptidase-like Zn-dependent dipeptidase
METLRDWTGSWKHVAIGTDFDGFTDPPDDCKNSSELPKVRKLLESNGLAPAEVEAVLSGNARRVLQLAWR